MVKCDNCGRHISSFGGSFKIDGKTVCYKCEKPLRMQQKKEESKKTEIMKSEFEGGKKEVKQKEFTHSLGINTVPTLTGVFIKILGIISGIICIIAGISMLSISARETSIMLVYYNSMGIFVIGFGLFVIMLSWGIAHLIAKKYRLY